MATKDPPSMALSDFNLKKVNTKELSQHLAGSIKIGGNVTIIGRRGTGKTVISKEEIKKADMREVYINLSVMERTDIGGYPNIMDAQRQSKYIGFLMPQFFEPLIEGKKKVVALLDEADKSDPSILAPLLEFIQFRSINNTPLPNLHAVILTANLISEGGSRPSLPLLDRTEKYLVEADVQSWLDWAGKSGRIHPSISAYISDHGADLFGKSDQEENYSSPSPRSWDQASQIIFKGEKLGWSTDLLNAKVAGCVGKDAGLKYQNYYDHYIELLPMVEDIYQGKDVSAKYKPLEPSKKLVTCMIVCARLASFLDSSDKDKLPPCVEYVGKFLTHVEYENTMVSVRSQIQVIRLMNYKLDEAKYWKDLLEKITKLCQ
jgi:hypothetical protein